MYRKHKRKTNTIPSHSSTTPTPQDTTTPVSDPVPDIQSNADRDWNSILNACPSLKHFFSIVIPAALKQQIPFGTTAIIGADSSFQELIIKHIELAISDSVRLSKNKIFDYKTSALAAIFTSLNDNDCCIIPGDISKYSKTLLLDLKNALIDYQLEIVIGKDPSANKIDLDLPQFSGLLFVGSLELIPSLLNDAIQNIVNVRDVPKDILYRPIIREQLEKSDLVAPDAVINRIAFEARNSLPVSFCKKITDYMFLNDLGNIVSEDIIDQALGFANSDTPTDLSITDLDQMDPYEFENFVLNLFEKLGYKCKHIGQSGDQGIDVLAERDDIHIGIQAKCYSGTVGNSAVQEVLAGVKYYNLDKGFVLTNSTFTTSARKLAESSRVALWDRQALIQKLSTLENTTTR